MQQSSSPPSTGAPPSTLTPPTGSAKATSTDDRVPKSLPAGVWNYQEEQLHGVNRAFLEQELLGAGTTLARVYHELPHSRMFSPMALGEIVEKRSFTASGDVNPVSKQKKSQPLTIEDSQLVYQDDQSTWTPRSLVAAMDGLSSIKWSMILIEWGGEADVEKFFSWLVATHRWWRRWCWRWPAFFLTWFSVCSFTSRRMKNRLAHILHGNISVRVSNVTSAVGKALPIMQLAQDGLHLLSETKHDSSIVRRLQREAVCFSSRNEEKAQFVFGPESKGSCGIGLCAGPKVLVYVVWFNLRKIPQLLYGFIKVVWLFLQLLSEQFPGIAQKREKQSFIFSNCMEKCTTHQRQTSC